MTTADILKTANNLPLHDPARMALLDAYKIIVDLRQSLDYANAARGGIGSLKRMIAEKNQQLDDVRIDRSNLLCACARIAHGVGTADDYSNTARDAIAGLCDRAANEVDNAKISSGIPYAESDCYAGDCTTCGGPVFYRDGKPGEYDHECKKHNSVICANADKPLDTLNRF